jgi:hypothetical protein
VTFRKPFTRQQRQHAISVYRSFRITLKTIRYEFRPLSPQQREIASELRQAVREFEQALRAADAKINVDETMIDMDRMITTRMSVNIVADLLKRGFTVEDVADAIHVNSEFVQRVQKKVHTLRHADVQLLAKLAGLTPQRLLLNSLRPVKPEFRKLFEVVRQQLELTEAPAARKRPKKCTRSRAA